LKSVDQIYQIHLKGELDRAEGLYLAAPQSAKRDLFLGTMYLQMDRYGLAKKYLESSLEIPKKMGYSNLLVALRKLGRYEEGCALGEAALEMWGDEDRELQSFYSNYASCLIEAGHLERAIKVLDAAIELDPSHVDSLWNQGVAKIGMGDWSGWQGFDQGFNAKERGMSSVVRELDDYEGQDLTDKTIIVWGEQGLGDEIIFANCLNDLIADAGHVIYECHPRLEAIMKQSFPDCEVSGTRKSPDRARWDHRSIDYHVAIGTLPLYYRNHDDDFPDKGYLKADEDRVQYWRDKFPGKKIVGLAWRGGVERTGSFKRSIPLKDFMPPEIEGVQYVSLQYGNAFEEADIHGLYHDDGAIDDLTELNNLTAACDLVISVIQTSVHMAGALDVPTWCLTPQPAPWKFQPGESMIWHPSVKQYHQTQRGVWDDVLKRIHEDIRSWA